MSGELFDDPEVCQAVLMDYYRHPRCAGVCPAPTHRAEADNPACGDIVRLGFEISNSHIRQARAAGAGCAVSQAAASLLAERLEGTALEEAHGVLALFSRLLSSGDHPLSADERETLRQLAALKVITSHPARVQCAAVSLRAAGAALPGPRSADGGGCS